MPLEAMASGRPVIAYKAGGALESVIGGMTGIFFEKQSVDSLVEAVKKIDEKKVTGYILDNSQGILKLAVNKKEEKGSRSPTRIQLREFLDLNPKIIKFTI